MSKEGITDYMKPNDYTKMIYKRVEQNIIDIKIRTLYYQELFSIIEESLILIENSSMSGMLIWDCMSLKLQQFTHKTESDKSWLDSLLLDLNGIIYNDNWDASLEYYYLATFLTDNIFNRFILQKNDR